MSDFDRRGMLLPALLISIAGCESDVTRADANAFLVLDVVHGEGVDLSRIEQGRVILEGPTPKDVFITPGVPHTIDGLVPGTYTVAIVALTGGEVVVYGERTGVVVNAGAPVPVAVTMNTFVPILFELPATFEQPGSGFSSTFSAKFTPVPGAAGYKLEWADNPAFQNQTTIFTDTPAWIVGPFSRGTYYFRVRAVSKKTGTDGKLSPVGTATVILTSAISSAQFVMIPAGSFQMGSTNGLPASSRSIR